MKTFEEFLAQVYIMRCTSASNIEFSFSLMDGSATDGSATNGSVTIVMTFGIICTCVGFEDDRPQMSTTVLGMNLRYAENDNLG